MKKTALLLAALMFIQNAGFAARYDQAADEAPIPATIRTERDYARYKKAVHVTIGVSLGMMAGGYLASRYATHLYRKADKIQVREDYFVLNPRTQVYYQPTIEPNLERWGRLHGKSDAYKKVGTVMALAGLNLLLFSLSIRF